MAEFPILPIYPQRWIADLGHLDIEIQGAIFILVQHAWLQPDNGLPDDDRDLARRLGIHPSRWRRIGPEVRRYFETINGRIYNKGASKERQYLADRSEKGRTLVEQRWQKFRANLLEKNNTTDTGRIYNPHPHPHQHKKKEEDAEADASAVPPSGSMNGHGHATVIDLKAAIFGVSLEWLATATGKPAPRLRGLLGKWCKDHGDGNVLDALAAAQRESPVEPIAWLQARLAGHKRPRPSAPAITPLGVGG